MGIKSWLELDTEKWQNWAETCPALYLTEDGRQMCRVSDTDCNKRDCLAWKFKQLMKP